MHLVFLCHYNLVINPETKTLFGWLTGGGRHPPKFWVAWPGLRQTIGHAASTRGEKKELDPVTVARARA